MGGEGGELSGAGIRSSGEERGGGGRWPFSQYSNCSLGKRKYSGGGGKKEEGRRGRRRRP